MGMVRLDTGKVHCCRIKIHQFHKAVGNTSIQRYSFGRLDQHRNIGQTMRESILILFGQIIITGIISMVREEKDCSIIITTGIFECLNQSSKLFVYLHAHSQINCPHFIPVCLGILFQAGHILPDKLLNIRFIGIRKIFGPSAQFCPVDCRKIRFFYLIGRMREHQS